MKAFILSILLDLLKYLFILMWIMANLSQADLDKNVDDDDDDDDDDDRNNNVGTLSVQLSTQVLRRPLAI